VEGHVVQGCDGQDNTGIAYTWSPGQRNESRIDCACWRRRSWGVYRLC
jgi:hypothetical protein